MFCSELSHDGIRQLSSFRWMVKHLVKWRDSTDPDKTVNDHVMVILISFLDQKRHLVTVT